MSILNKLLKDRLVPRFIFMESWTKNLLSRNRRWNKDVPGKSKSTSIGQCATNQVSSRFWILLIGERNQKGGDYRVVWTRRTLASRRHLVDRSKITTASCNHFLPAIKLLSWHVEMTSNDEGQRHQTNLRQCMLHKCRIELQRILTMSRLAIENDKLHARITNLEHQMQESSGKGPIIRHWEPGSATRNGCNAPYTRSSTSGMRDFNERREVATRKWYIFPKLLTKQLLNLLGSSCFRHGHSMAFVFQHQVSVHIKLIAGTCWISNPKSGPGWARTRIQSFTKTNTGTGKRLRT